MLVPRIIPCLDVKDGRVVKGVRFQNLQDAGDPVALACAYDQQGADELVLLDVSATPEGRKTALHTVQKVRLSLSIPLSVGGGVKKIDDAQALLQAGADKVAINTAAVDQPQLLYQMARQFGSQCTVLALDAARTEQGTFEVVVLSGRKRTGIDALNWATHAQEKGAGEILLTSWDCDGTKNGYDLELIHQVTKRVSIPVIASGGASSALHLVQALQAGASAVLAASIFHYGEYDIPTLKQYIAQKGIEVRL